VDPKTDVKAEKTEEIVWETTANGQVKKSFFNLLNYLKLPAGGLNHVFGFNEFTGQVEFIAPAPWHKGRMPSGEGERAIQDKDLALLKGYLAVKHGFEQTVGALAEAIVVVSHSNKFHPVRDYLEALKWDGTPRLDQWLTRYAGAADSSYTRAVGRKTLCAAVQRILKPGCKFDQVLTLEGNQGAGKSMLCAALGGKWSADFSVDPQDPDTVAAMQGKWFVELAELAVLRRTEMSALKAFITRRTDKVRVAYGRLHQEYPRQSVFIGSINPEADNAYLADPTGNRRWWPVEVGDHINYDGVKRDRDQLFAEAVFIMKEGRGKGTEEALYMDNLGLEKEARGVVEQRQVEHAWTERISAWLADKTLGGGLKFVTARDIFIDAMGGIDKQLTRREIIAIATVMRRLGWESVTQRQGARVLRGYVQTGERGRGGGEELEGLI
jgi:predicted P-loop ATPase